MKMPMAFMSYAHRDDRSGDLTKLRKLLKNEIEEQIGGDFEIFQDSDSIRVGANWKRQIEESLDKAFFFIPIVTPSFFTSEYCREELRLFLDRENTLGRDDLIFPVYYRPSQPMDDDTKREEDELAQAIHAHQFADWRPLRGQSFESAGVVRGLEDLAGGLCQAFRDLDEAWRRATESQVPDATSSNTNAETADEPSAETGRRDARPSGRLRHGYPHLVNPTPGLRDNEAQAQDESELLWFNQRARLITVDQRMIDSYLMLISISVEHANEATYEERFEEASEYFKEAVNHGVRALNALKRGRRGTDPPHPQVRGAGEGLR